MAIKKVNEFLCGFACALIEVYEHPKGNAAVCREIIKRIGYKMQHSKDAGLIPQELDTLKKIMTR